MIAINLREAKETIRELIKIKAPRSIILLGSPGVGKTSCLRQIAQEFNAKFELYEAPSIDFLDVRGVINLQGGRTKYTLSPLYPEQANLNENQMGFFVIDEITGGDKDIQKSLNALFLERRLGNDYLPEGWKIFGTGNYVTDDAAANRIITTLHDRAYFFHIEPNFQIWKADFALLQRIHPSIVAYLNWKPDHFCTFDQRDRREQKIKTFVTPRSWELASDVLYTSLNDKLRLVTLAGCISEGIAYEFQSFLEIYEKLPNPLSIFSGKFNKYPEEPSILFALSGALIGYLDNLPESLSLAVAIEGLLNYSLQMPAKFSDFAILMINDAFINYKMDLIQSTLWLLWVNKYQHVMLP